MRLAYNYLRNNRIVEIRMSSLALLVFIDFQNLRISSFSSEKIAMRLIAVIVLPAAPGLCNDNSKPLFTFADRKYLTHCSLSEALQFLLQATPNKQHYM